MKQIEIINTQQVWVEYKQVIEITEEELNQLKNEEIEAGELWYKVDIDITQSDMWGGEEENYFEYREVN